MCLLGRATEKSVKLWLLKYFCERKADKACLLARAGQDSSRIGQSGSMDETEADTV
jgi:hypothetical protein